MMEETTVPAEIDEPEVRNRYRDLRDEIATATSYMDLTDIRRRAQAIMAAVADITPGGGPTPEGLRSAADDEFTRTVVTIEARANRIGDRSRLLGRPRRGREAAPGVGRRPDSDPRRK